jgi:prephenate dehydratase
LGDIREVHSHPMALQQCFDFLGQYHWKLVETEDTALSAKMVQRHKSKHIAAVAGQLAAELFGLHIVAPNIHSEKANYTRFLVLRRKTGEARNGGADKASIKFHTDHTRGSLARVLTEIAACGINLSKLQSMPIPGSEWQYSFYADMEFGSPQQFGEVMERIKPITQEVKVFGVYKKGTLIQ